MVSRVALPDLKTASSLLKVSALSGTKVGSRTMTRPGTDASSRHLDLPPGKRPLSESSAQPAPRPRKKPRLNASRMFLVRYRSS